MGDDCEVDVDLCIDVLTYLTKGEESNLKPWLLQVKEQVHDAGLMPPAFITFRNVQGLLRLLKDCLLTHRWEDALQVVHMVTQHRFGSASAIWKAGSEIFLADGESNSHLLELLYNQLKMLPTDYNCKEVILEYVFYLLNQGRTAEAQELIRFSGEKLKKAPTVKSRYIDLQYTLYQGMVNYTLWLEQKIFHEKLKGSDDGDPFLQASTLTNDEEYLQSHAARAIEYFRDIESKCGVWDIFVTKYVELLEFTEKTDEALNVLKIYKEKHDENPNAHRMLYAFMKRHGASRENRILILQDYVKLVPSDVLVLELCDLIQEDSDDVIFEVLQLLFNMLDYFCWQTCEHPWKKLVTVLENLRKKDVTSLEKLWSVRSDWWPAYHFTSSMLSTENQSLLVCKVKVACLLLGPECTLIEEAKKNLNKENLRDLRKLQSHWRSQGICLQKR